MRAFLLLAYVFVLLGGSTFGEEPKDPPSRNYDDGPLRQEEFVGRPDRSASGRAFTATRVEFKYEYLVRKKNDRFQAKLTKFKATSRFLPESSWWKGRDNADLLDHEQGHLDIAQEMALRLQLQYKRAVEKKSVPGAEAATQAKAVRSLVNKLEKVMKTVNEKLKARDKEYDSATSHGMRYRSQAEFRRVQMESLKRLEKELGIDSKNRRPSRTETCPSAKEKRE